MIYYFAKQGGLAAGVKSHRIYLSVCQKHFFLTSVISSEAFMVQAIHIWHTFSLR